MTTPDGSIPPGGTTSVWKKVAASYRTASASPRPKNRAVMLFSTPGSETLFNMSPAAAAWARTVHQSSVIFNFGKLANSAQVEQLLYAAFGKMASLSTRFTRGKDLLAEALFSDPEARVKAIITGFLYQNTRLVGTLGLPVNKNIVKINLYNIPNFFSETDLQGPLIEALRPHDEVVHLKIYQTPIETFLGEATCGNPA
ncbi:hypothetical protein CLU79DRAFT_717621 [Phycomyces nitens]|nr:hypothetical protein CLU79DRAFT_717621 [Phycomyces nitens]